MPIKRKLAAIMFTDIVGSTAQMSKDEAVAISLLNKKESVLKPLIAKHNGTYVKSTGDGSLSHFNSAVDAATCAKRFQESIYDDKDLNVRVGVHLGDTIFEKGDIRGDGVNIASHLESMAVGGGVFVSKEVHDQLANQKEFEGVSLGLQSMKGVGRLIEVYGLKGDLLTDPKPSDYQDDKIDKHTDDEVPSIAIIPFDNKGADEDVFYAYGISADLISDVSSAGLIRVPSLKRVEELTNLSLDEKATKLDVRYTAEGTLWKMGDMFQLSIELYDTKDKKIVWSDRWQENWDNLPTIKMNLSNGMLKALNTKPKVEQKVDTTNPEAYEFYLKAKYKYNERKNREDIDLTRGLLQKAIDLDDNLLLAKNMLGNTYRHVGDYDKAMEIYNNNFIQAKKYEYKEGMAWTLANIADIHIKLGNVDNYNKGFELYTRSLEICEQLDDKIGIALNLNNLSWLYQWIIKDLDKAKKYTSRSLELFKETKDEMGMSQSYRRIASLYDDKGDINKALENCRYALKIDEVGNYKQSLARTFFKLGEIYYTCGDYNKTLDYYNRALKIFEECGLEDRIGWLLCSLGITYIYQAKYDKAIQTFEKAQILQKRLKQSDEDFLWSTMPLYYCYKKLGKSYDENKIYKLIDSTDNIHVSTNYLLYQLIEDISYLENAYNQIKERTDNLEPEVKLKFLSYPIPKAIVEEWEKVNTDKN